MNQSQSHDFRHTAPAALAWLVGAGIDVLVDDAPRNWLAAPAVVVPKRPLAPPNRAAAPVVAPAADSLAAGIDSLAALTAAIADFAHPLRRPGLAPELVTGNPLARVIIAADMAATPDSPEARLRDRMLAAIGLTAENTASLNLLPWPTSGGRPVRPAEISDFAPFVTAALRLLKPRLILAFGEHAISLSGPVARFNAERGAWRLAGDIPLLATFHPRRLLQQPDLKRLAWADLQAFAERLTETSA